MTRHPKFQALLTCLAEAAQQRDSWHAIVFARTREAVRTLAALLQARLELPGMQVGGRGDERAGRRRKLGWTQQTPFMPLSILGAFKCTAMRAFHTPASRLLYLRSLPPRCTP